MNHNPNGNGLNRRQFLNRLTKAGISVTAACAAGFWFYDPNPPALLKPEHSNLILLDFSIHTLGQKMSIVRGEDRVATLQMAIKSLGGIETFITKGDRVLLKVNAAPCNYNRNSPALFSRGCRIRRGNG